MLYEAGHCKGVFCASLGRFFSLKPLFNHAPACRIAFLWVRAVYLIDLKWVILDFATGPISEGVYASPRYRGVNGRVVLY